MAESEDITPGAADSEIARVRARLKEAEEELQAIRSGRVDALVVSDEGDPRVLMLQGAEEPYRVMVDTMNEGALVLTGQGMILYANQHFATLLQEPLEGIRAASLLFYVAEAERPDITALLAQGLKERAGAFKTLYRRDGTPVQVKMALSPLEIKGIPSICIAVTDVSELRRAEQAAKESEERYRAIFNTVVNGIVVIDEMGIIVSVNTSVEKMFGYSAAEMVGRNVNFLMPSPDREQHDQYLENYRRTGIKKIIGIGRETTALRKDGSLFPIRLAVSEANIGGRRMFTGQLHDITERKRAEAVLLKEAERNKVLLELYEKSKELTENELYDLAVNHAVALTDSEVGFLHLVSDDQKTIILTAWNREALKTCAVVTETHYAIEKAGNWADCARAGKPVVYNDFAHSPGQKGIPEGHNSIRRFLSIPVMEGGKVRVIFGAGNKAQEYGEQDIIHLQLVANELQKILQQRRADEGLKRAKEEAETANRAKDQFLAVLSHELRTPLTPVLVTVSALQEQEDLSVELRAEMDMIRRNVDMEAKLIDDLLDVTRISRGKIELRPENVDAYLLLRTALEICQRDIEAKSQDITLSFQAAEHYVRADATRLRQVFWNLLKNAVAYTPDRGRISVRASNVDGRLKVEIKDTGVGIRPEVLPRIFNAFERGEQTGPRRFGGLGLGLSIAKAVVEMHQGTLTAFSEGPGKGATFAVEIPVIPTPEEKLPPPSIASAGKEGLGKILLVDDHTDTLLTMARLLRKWGYAVVTADCMRTALELAHAEPFDVLVSDLGLPDGSGLDIMREVRARYQLRGIALSGYGTEEDIRQSREAGFEEHLVKPVSFEALRVAVQQITS